MFPGRSFCSLRTPASDSIQLSNVREFETITNALVGKRKKIMFARNDSAALLPCCHNDLAL